MAMDTTSCCKHCPSTARLFCVRRERRPTSRHNRRHERTRATTTNVIGGMINNRSLNFAAPLASHAANSSPATHVCGAFFLPFRAYIPRTLTLQGRISAPVAASINTAMKGVASDRRAEKEMIVTKNSREALKRRADARFKQEARAIDGRKAMTEYEAQVLAIREKTARLRELRLAKEAQAQNEEPAPKTNVRPFKKRGTR
jgi:hypothetical protein